MMGFSSYYSKLIACRPLEKCASLSDQRLMFFFFFFFFAKVSAHSIAIAKEGFPAMMATLLLLILLSSVMFLAFSLFFCLPI